MKKISYIFKRKKNRQIMQFIDSLGYVIFRPRLRPSQFNKILIIRTAHIGDVLFTTPLINNLRRSLPNAQIHYLCGDWAEEIVRNNRQIDKIIIYNAFWQDRNKRRQLGLHTLSNLKKEKYDLVIQCGFDYKDNILAKIIGARYIIGHDVCGFGFLLDKSPVPSDTKSHDKDLHLKLLETIGIKSFDNNLELKLSPVQEQEAELLARKYNLTNYLAIGPGAGEKTRLWSVDSWVKFILLSENKFANIVLLGSMKERAISDEIINKSVIQYPFLKGKIINLTGTNSLIAAAGIIKRAKIFVGMESSLVHVANALHKKSIAIFSGFTDTIRFAIDDKYTITLKKTCQESLSCQPAQCIHRECLIGVLPEEVFAAVKKHLEEAN